MADLILPNEGEDQRRKDAATSSLVLPPVADPIASANAREATRTDPERFAKAKRIAEQLAVPLPTAERNLEAFDSESKLRNAQLRMLADPFYADRMRDPEFAKLSQGDEPALTSISKTIASLPWRALQGVASGVTAIPAGLAGAFAAPFELASQFIGRPLAGKLLPTDPFAIVGERYRNVSRNISGYAERVADVPKDAGILERGVFSGLQSLGTNLPPMLYAMFTGNAQTALSIISGITGGQSYVKGRDAGLSPAQATQFGATDAAIEYVTEVIPFTKLLGDMKAGTPFIRAFMRNQVGEQLGEQAATVLQDFNEWATLHPEKPFSEYLAERPSAAIQTAIATVIGSGGQVAIMHALQTDAMRKEAKANAEAQAVQKLLADAGASLLRERSPATFTQFVAAASANSPVDAVYVDAQTFMQEAQKAGIDVAAAMPETALSLEDALQANSDVRIPIAELATVLPGTTMEASIIPHLKTDPDGATQAEVSDKAWVEETQKQTEKILAEQAFDDAWTRSIGVVRDDLSAQLTKANRFTRDVNEAYASFMSAFYATQAKRLNITPEEMYARYPLQIRAQGVAGDNVLSQPEGGAQVNIGLKVGEMGAITPEQAVEALRAAGVEITQQAVYQSDTEQTLVARINRSLTPEEASAVSAATQQEAIAQVADTGEGGLFGPAAEKWGPFNPEFFIDISGERLSALGKGPKVSVRQQQPDAVSHAGVHYSHSPNLSVLIGARFGTGIKGAERARLAGVRDSRITNRVSLYVADDGKLPRAEFGLGPHVYKVTLTNLYDFATDPRNILSRVPRGGDPNARLNAIEQMVVEEGFDGYANRGQIVVLGADVPVQYVAGDNTFNQDSIPSTWYYSELTRQIEKLDVPEEGLTPAEWKARIYSPPSEKTVALRDAKNKPTGETKTVQVAERVLLPGVKMGEVEATGILDWLDMHVTPEFTVIRHDGAVVAAYRDLVKAERSAENLNKGLGIDLRYKVTKFGLKLSRADVLGFLNKNGIQVEEQILTGEGGSAYYETDPEVEEPESDYMQERAQEVYDSMDEAERERYLRLDDGEWSDEEHREQLLARLVEDEIEAHYNGPESTTTSRVTLEVGHREFNFQVTRQYGEVEIYSIDDQELVTNGFVSERRTDVESTIRAWVALNTGTEAANTEYSDERYRTPGGDNYFELKLLLPGQTRFTSGHFTETGGDNLLAHVRADTRGKTLFIDEVQSDWAQKGRDEGFKGDKPVDTTGWTATPREVAEDHSVWWDIENADGGHVTEVYAENAAEAIRRASLESRGAIQPAPFVTKTDAWVSLVWKRLIRYAAENDLDEIVWTRGEQQTQRWSGNLRKHVDYIEWVKTADGVHLQGFKVNNYVGKSASLVADPDGTFAVNDFSGIRYASGFTTRAAAAQALTEMPASLRRETLVGRGRSVVDTTYGENQLSDAIGKAMGRQILEDPNQSGVIEGDNIRIDDIGMSQFYGDAYGNKADGNPAILAKVANDVLKKLGGGKVEALAVSGDNGMQIDSTVATDGTKVWLILRGEDVVFRSESEKEAVEWMEGAASLNPGFKITPEMKAKALAGLPLFQNNRGQITFGSDITQQPSVITLLQNADLSTFLHETGHFYLEVLRDMAAKTDAPAEIVQDFNTALSWFGVTTEQWRGMSLEERRPHHEKWARGFEAYLFEGKAPSTELQGLFARFRAWFLNVYQQLTALNVVLTPEVRQVMGRLIASNEEILRAESARAFAPLYETRPPGMSEAEWVEYQQLAGEATQEAVDQLQTRSVRDMRYASRAKAAALKRLQREASDKRAGVRAEVAAEVQAEPVYQAIRFLRTGETITQDGEEIKIDEGFKLDKAALAEMYPETALGNPDLTKLSRMTMEGGLRPDLVAEMFGFTSGDHLVRDIIDAEPAKQKIDGLTDQRMLERYGDLADPEAMERAANEAVHNDVRARFVATELRTLDKAVGQRSVLVSAAKEFAAGMVARKRVRTIRPHIYAAAESKAAKAAERALAAGDQRTAATEKRNQLVNLYAAKASHQALSEVEKGVAYLKRVAESDTLDPAYREQITALMERFDLRRTTVKEAARRASLTQWIASQREQNMEPVIDPALENEALRKPYQDMTFEEFRGLVDSVRNIEHLGRLKHKLVQAADQRAFAAIVDDAANTIASNARRTLPVQLERNSWLARAKKSGAQFIAMHRKWASFWREMDGYNDFGVLQRLFVQTANTAGTNEAVMLEQATVKLSELLKPILAEGKLSRKTKIPGQDFSLSREGRIMVALNAGNEGNLQRLMDGDRWTAEQVQAVIDTLTKEEMDFVQSVWDFIGSYRTQIAEQQKRLTGIEPEWVEPRRVVTPHGVYAGGYFPAKYDTDRSTRSLSDEAAAGLIDAWRAKRGAAQTRAGFTKGRADKVVDRPLRKDFGVITQHVAEVTHRLAWQDWLVDTNRLLRASAIDAAIRDHYGPEVMESLRNAVEDIAAGDVPAQNAFESLLAFVRKGATIVGLGWRVTTSLLQPLGLTQSIVRIGPKWVGRGLSEWLGDAVRMESTVRKITEKSDFMRLRSKTMQREISEIRNQVSGKNSAIEASYFYLIQKMQLVADVPTWLGQYHKAIEAGADESTAIAQADQAVLDAQGGGQVKDLAAIQRGGQGLKLFTNFYSFFNTTFNLTSEAVGRTNFRKPAAVGILAADLLLLYTIPALMGDLMKEALSDDDDDEDKLVRKLIAGQLNYMLGTMVGVREVAGVARTALGLPGDYGGPASLRLVGEATKLGKQIGQGEADEAFWKSLNSTAGILFHYPAGQVNNTLDGFVSLYQGETSNPAALITGSSK